MAGEIGQEVLCIIYRSYYEDEVTNPFDCNYGFFSM